MAHLINGGACRNAVVLRAVCLAALCLCAADAGARPTITFSLINEATGNETVYITRDASRNQMVLTVTNGGSQPVSLVGMYGASPFAPSAATASGPTALYVGSQGVVQAVQQPFLSWEAEGWTAKYFADSSGSPVWGLFPLVNSSLAPGASIKLPVTNWTFPAPAGVPDAYVHESVSWYGISGASYPFPAEFLVHVTFLPGTHPYLSDVLSMELTNSTVIVTTPGGHVYTNTIVLTFCNLLDTPLVPASTKWYEEDPELDVYFETTGAGALLTLPTIGNIEVNPVSPFASNTFEALAVREAPSPYFPLVARGVGDGGTHGVIPAKACAGFAFVGIISEEAVGPSPVTIRSSFFPGYFDTTFVVTAHKVAS